MKLITLIIIFTIALCSFSQTSQLENDKLAQGILSGDIQAVETFGGGVLLIEKDI